MRVHPNRKVYEPGTPYSGCVAGRSFDYPSLCSKNEPIKSIPYPIARARYQSDVNPNVNPLSYFGIPSMTNNLQPPLSNGFVSPLNNFQSPRLTNQYEVADLRGNQRRQPVRKNNRKTSGRRITRRTNQRNPRQIRRKNQKSNRNRNRNRRPSVRTTRRKTTRKNKTEIQSQSNQMFPNPFSFLFG